jgi:methyl-accepting chemotaxis protein
MKNARIGRTVVSAFLLFSVLPAAVLSAAVLLGLGKAVLFGIPVLTVVTIIVILWVAAGVVVVVRMAYGLSQSFHHAVDDVKRIGSGDLTAATAVSSRTEVSDLERESGGVAARFNNLIGNIDQSAEEFKHLIDSVHATSVESAQISSRITATAEDVARGASRQAEDASKVSRITSEFVQKIESVSGSAEEMKTKADTALEMASFGKTNIEELMSTSETTRKNMQDATDRMNELGKLAEEITQITTAITDIAAQTNLLSLNAAIEAARAGESGKGFAVVADQIRKLADASLHSSKEISEIIQRIQTETIRTTETIKGTVEALSSQVSSVYKTKDAFVSISDAMTALFQKLLEVRDGVKGIVEVKEPLSRSISGIAAVAESAVASTEEISSLLYSQTNSAEMMVSLSSDFSDVVTRLNSQLNGFHFARRVVAKKKLAVLACVDIPFFDDTYSYARAAAAKLGVDVQCDAPRGYDGHQQALIIEKMRAEKVEGLGIGPIDSPEVRQSLAAASKQGMKIVFFDTDLSGIPRLSFIGTENKDAGRKLGALAVKLTGGNGQVLLSTSNQTTLNLQERVTGLQEVFNGKKGMRVVGIDSPSSSDLEARWQSISRWLREHPEINCFVCVESMGSYFAEKIRRQKKDMIVVLFDKTEQSLELIRSGSANAIMAQRQGLWGELVVRRLYEAMHGKALKDFEDTGVYEINKRNLSVFAGK